MANFRVFVKNKGQTVAIVGATVKADYQDWLGGNKSVEVNTDSSGEAPFSIGVSQTQIEITATKGLSIGKGSIFIDFFGNPNPETLTIYLDFNPSAIFQFNNKSLYDFVKGNITLVLIIGAVIVSVGGIIYINSLAKSGASETVKAIPKPEPKPEPKIEEKTA